MKNKNLVLLKTSSGLWVVWGLVHMLAGVIVLSADTASGFSAIADAVSAEHLLADYHPATGGIFIWRGSMSAVLVTALIGGLADLGYFVFLDMGGFVNFIPGTVMTIFSATAIVLSLSVFLQTRKHQSKM